MGVRPKAMTALYPADILFQAPCWAWGKARLGLAPGPSTSSPPPQRLGGGHGLGESLARGGRPALS